MNRKLFQNTVWIIACKIGQSVLGLIVGMLTARYLGPSNYGIINYAASITAFFFPLAHLGLQSTAVSELVLSPNQEGETMGTILGMSVLGGLASVVSIFLFSLVVHRGETETILVCVLQSLSLLFQMTEMIQYWYQAKLMSKYTSLISMAAYTLVSVYKVFIIVTGKSIYWFAVTMAFDYLLITAALLLLYRRLGTQKLSFNMVLVKPLFTRSKHYILSGMMVSLFAQTDKVMIKWICGNAQSGYYAVAVTCATMSSFVFQAIIDSYRPVIVADKRNNMGSYQKYMVQLYSIIIYLGVAQSIVLTVFAKLVIGIIYGQDYLPAVPILQMITWYSTFSYMGAVRNVWILAEEQQKYLWIINLSGAILNILANILLIPIMGAVGAAVASVVTQFFTNFVLCFLVRAVRPTARLIFQALDPRTLLNLLPKRSRTL